MAYTEVYLIQLLNGFYAGTLPTSRFDHSAHLAVGIDLLLKSPETDALNKLRDAIHAFNRSHRVPNTDTQGYHETLTVYWVKAIAHFLRRTGHTDRVKAWKQMSMLPEGRSSAPLQYWSRQALYSPEARRAWLPPDLHALPF